MNVNKEGPNHQVPTGNIKINILRIIVTSWRPSSLQSIKTDIKRGKKSTSKHIKI